LPPSSPEDVVTGSPGVFRALGAAVVLVRRSLRDVLLAYALNVVLALLLGAVVFDAVRTSLGSSLAGTRMRAGWDARWYDSFSTQAQGVASTFRPAVAGPGGLFEGLDAFLDGFSSLLARGPGTGILLVAVVYLLAWSFLRAGFLGTFAESPGGAGFLARGARWFPRILPVTLLGFVFYAALLGPVRAALADRLDSALHDVSDERVRLAWTAAAYGALWTLVLLGNLVLDYAKVLLVLRDQEGRVMSALRAFGDATRLVVTRPRLTLGLYAVTGLLGLAGMALYAAVVPIASDASGLAVAGTFLLGQILILARIAWRALFLAGEVVVGGGVRTAPRAEMPAEPESPPMAQAV
jgi:hypothetical protein